MSEPAGLILQILDDDGVITEVIESVSSVVEVPILLEPEIIQIIGAGPQGPPGTAGATGPTGPQGPSGQIVLGPLEAVPSGLAIDTVIVRRTV